MEIKLPVNLQLNPGVVYFRMRPDKICFSGPRILRELTIQALPQAIDALIETLKSDSTKKFKKYNRNIKSELRKIIIQLKKEKAVGGRKFQALKKEEILYYRNNILFMQRTFKQDGLILQKELKNKKICLVGAGGATSMILVSLVGMGVGEIKIIDCDKVESNNLPRQIIYNWSDIGKSKALAARRSIMKRNPFITVRGYDLRIDPSSLRSRQEVQKIVKNCDIVVVSADDPSPFSILRFIQLVCFKTGVSFLSSAYANGFIAPLVVPGETSCIECMIKNFFPSEPIENATQRKFFSSWMSVPYYHLAEGNTLIAREILNFLLTGKSELMNCIHFNPILKKTVPKSKICKFCSSYAKK